MGRTRFVYPDDIALAITLYPYGTQQSHSMPLSSIYYPSKHSYMHIDGIDVGATGQQKLCEWDISRCCRAHQHSISLNRTTICLGTAEDPQPI
jgi:hypothetical protein